MKPSATPERILELCRIVENAKGDRSIEKIREIAEPAAFAGNTQYFGIIKNAAIEIGLLTEQNNELEYVGDKQTIKSYDSFRRYCNSIIFNDKSWEFYKICKAFCILNDEWLRLESITSNESVTLLSKYSSYPSTDLQKTIIPASRFWLSFLGFGYVQEGTKIVFLPNAYVAMRDFISLSNLEKGKEYSIEEFFSLMPLGFSVLHDLGDGKAEINYALSNAIRQLHDSKEIILKVNPDSEKKWSLFPSNNHVIKNTVTHLIYKGIK